MSDPTRQRLRPEQTSRIRVFTGAALVVATCVLVGRADATAAQAVQLGAPVRAAVALIAGPRVGVRCTIPPGHVGLVEALGHVDWNRRLIELRPRICKNANALGRAPATAYSTASFAQAQ